MTALNQAYEKAYKKALEEGIKHEDNCPHRDRNVPIDELPCNCELRWWFRQGAIASQEHHRTKLLTN